MFRNKFAFISAMLSLFVYRVFASAVPGTPSTLAGLGVSAGLQRKAWDSKLKLDSVLDDVYNRLAGSVDVTSTAMQVPNDKIFMSIGAVERSSRSIVVPMTLPLSEAPQEGNAEPVLGNEEESRLVYTELFYNEIKKGVKSWGPGINFEDQAWTNQYAMENAKFALFHKELRGRRIREAEMLTFSSELTKDPVGKKQQFNPNVFIPNLLTQPVWDKTDLTTTAGAADTKGFYSARTFAGDFVEQIGAAMLSASGVGTTSKALLNVDWLTELENYVVTVLQLNPITIGGNSGYIFMISNEDAARLRDPSQTGSIASFFANGADLSKEEQMSIPGLLGRYGAFWFVQDNRSPTLTVTVSGTHTLKPGFMQPGNNDDRNRGAWSNTTGSPNYVFNVNRILGAGALAEWNVRDLSYAKESTEYGQIQGKASLSLSGIRAVYYDLDSPTDGAVGTRTIINKGSCLVLTSRKSIAEIV
jgi:hypothetical protein